MQRADPMLSFRQVVFLVVVMCLLPVGLVASESDRTSRLRPLRFWVNDEINRWTTDSDPIYDDVQVQDAVDPASVSAEERARIGMELGLRRDLENCQRLNVTITAQGPAGGIIGGVRLVCSWTQVVEGSPAIRLFRSVDETGGLAYLTDAQVALRQTMEGTSADDRRRFATTLGTVAAGGVTEVEAGPLAVAGDAGHPGYHIPLLFTAVGAGYGRLTIKAMIRDGGADLCIGRAEVWLDLKPMNRWYERWTCGEEWGTLPGALTHPVGWGWEYPALVSPADAPDYVVFVHGFNMTTAERHLYASTVFKRLWWNGFDGRFGTFEWPTTFGFSAVAGDPVLHYNGFSVSEVIAWNAAAKLVDLVERLQSQGHTVHLLAHSHGNVVCGEALRLLRQRGKKVASYIAMQAALPVNCYGGASASPSPPYTGQPFEPRFESWAWIPILNFLTAAKIGPDTPDRYQDILKTSPAGTDLFINMFNANDWALSPDVWGFAQLGKPDVWIRPDDQHLWEYGYARATPAPDPRTPENRFGAPDGDGNQDGRTYRYWVDRTLPKVPVLTALFQPWSDAGIPDAGMITYLAPTTTAVSAEYQTNRYDILGMVTEGRTEALGRVAAQINIDVDIQTLWNGAVDVPVLDPGTRRLLPFGHHRWHSGQFRGIIHENRSFWNAVITNAHLPQKARLGDMP